MLFGTKYVKRVFSFAAVVLPKEANAANLGAAGIQLQNVGFFFNTATYHNYLKTIVTYILYVLKHWKVMAVMVLAFEVQ